jgi:hypothetical protein
MMPATATAYIGSDGGSAPIDTPAVRWDGVDLKKQLILAKVAVLGPGVGCGFAQSSSHASPLPPKHQNN